MQVTDLLKRLLDIGVEFEADGTSIRWKNAGRHMTTDRVEALKDGKKLVIALLMLRKVLPGPEDSLGIDDRVLAAIETGSRTPGAVATRTRLGATTTYQSVSRLTDSGRIEQASDGSLALVSSRVAIPIRLVGTARRHPDLTCFDGQDMFDQRGVAGVLNRPLPPNSLKKET